MASRPGPTRTEQRACGSSTAICPDDPVGPAEPTVGQDAEEAERQRAGHGDDEDPGSDAHARLNDAVGERLPATAQPPANGGSSSTVEPGCTSTDAGSSVVTGRSPTITEQQASTSANRGDSACTLLARARRSASGGRARHLDRVGVGAGRGARRGPVAERDESNSRHLVMSSRHLRYPCPSVVWSLHQRR